MAALVSDLAEVVSSGSAVVVAGAGVSAAASDGAAPALGRALVGSNPVVPRACAGTAHPLGRST